MTLTADGPDFTAVLFAPRPRWYDDAFCHGVDPELFFPERGETTRAAKEVCAARPAPSVCWLRPQWWMIHADAVGASRSMLTRPTQTRFTIQLL